MENVFCKICRLGPINPENLGPLTHVGNIYCHANCLYFSSGLTQEADIDNPRLGFNERDILRLITSVCKKTCLYCGQTGANILCARKGCKRVYHFACGLPRNVTYQFHGSFKSYCHLHKVHFNKLNLPCKKYKAISERCVYCLEDITDNTKKFQYFRAQCCNGVYMHIQCARSAALNAGAFTKCPGCNSDQSFIDQLLQIGVNVPLTDAAWENNDNYADLYEPRRSCVAPKCICPYAEQKQSVASKRRRESADGLDRTRNDRYGYWKLILCRLCGGSEAHRGCLNMDKKYRMWYKCKTCTNVDIDMHMRRNRSQGMSGGQISRSKIKWAEFPQSSRVLRSRNC